MTLNLTPSPNDDQAPKAEQAPNAQQAPNAEQALDRMLSEADPIADPNATTNLGETFEDAVQRLQRVWRELETSPLTTNENSGQPQLSSDRLFRANITLRILAIAAGLLLLVGAAWWLRTAAGPKLIADQALDAAPNIAREPVPDIDLHENDHHSDQQQPSLKRNEPKVIEVGTVDDLITLAEEQNLRLPTLNIRLNEDALKDELGRWLAAWRLASPDARLQLESQWNKNRVYWLPWIKNWCGTWPDEALNHTAMEAIVRDQRAAAVPSLFTFLNQPKLRSTAWGHLCQLAHIEQLTTLLPRAETCNEIQSLAAALIRDASPRATDLLSQLVLRPGCRGAIKRLVIEWPDQHARHCWTRLRGKDEATHPAAAALLAVIPSPQIDAWLNTELRAGRHPVEAMSVLLMRDQPSAKQVLADAGRNQILAVNLPSAFQQVKRWNLKSTKITFLSDKACEKCSVSS